MKVVFVFCVVIAVTIAAKTCHDVSDCTCHEANQVANCENHVCTCVVTGVGKRAEHVCTTDADCVNYDCHGHGNPVCSHHGSAEHGHSLCSCQHA